MDPNPQFDFWYAVHNTEVLLHPASPLETFGTTILNYHLVTELLDSVDKIRIRQGRLKAYRPEILTPQSALENLLEGFGSEAREYAEWLRTHQHDLMVLRYGFAITNENTTEEIVTGKLREMADLVRDRVKKKADPLAAVVVGVDKPWEVCLLKLMVDSVQQSAPGHASELRRRGIRSEEDRSRVKLREELEEAFAAAARDPSRLDALGARLQAAGLFDEYQDRFFALLRRSRGG